MSTEHISSAASMLLDSATSEFKLISLPEYVNRNLSGKGHLLELIADLQRRSNSSTMSPCERHPVWCVTLSEPNGQSKWHSTFGQIPLDAR